MVKVVLLTADSRMAYQVKDWLRELNDDVRLETFSSLAGFLSDFDKSHQPAPVETEKEGEPAAPTEATAPTAAPNPGPEPAKGVDAIGADLEKKIRLLIVDLDLFDEMPFRWLAEAQKEVRQRGCSASDYPMRVLALAFEGGKHHPDKLRHDSVDDLVMKPLERAVFLQKVEVLVADEPKIKPTFLFRQKTDMVIEAGKDAVIDEISEFAVAIRNPSPLVEGVYAALHCEVFGAGADSRLIGRVYKNVRHPTIEGDYLVKFLLFGLNSRQLMNVRKYVRSHQVPVRTKPTFLSAKLKQRQAEPVPPEEMKRIAVIDMNRETFTQLKSSLESNVRGVSVQVFPSYTRFLAGLARLAQQGTDKPAAAPAVDSRSAEQVNLQELMSETREPAFPKGVKTTVIVTADTQALVRFEPALKKGQTILGREMDEWRDRPDFWRSSIEQEDREEFEEFLAYLGSGAPRGHALFRMVDADGNMAYLEADGSIEKSGDADGVALMRLDVKEIDREEWHAQSSLISHEKGASAYHFDAIFVDGAVIRDEVQPWLDGLQELMRKAGVLKLGEPLPKIVILADERSKIQPDKYRVKGVADFVYKPFDRKFITEKAIALLPDLKLLEEPEIPPFVPSELPARLAKDVRMEEIAEYGLTIRHPSPLKERVFMRFFSPLFGEDSEGIIGRCVLSEPAGEGEKIYYQCHFVFFGTGDELQKRIRTWIREDYVHKKEGVG